MGDGIREKSLADSGDSINVMPYTLFLKLRLEDLRPTRMTVQLAALNDVRRGKMTLIVGEEKVILTLPNAMKHTLDHDNTLYFTDET